MGTVFEMQWEVSLITWLQQAMGSAGTFAAKVFAFVGDETFTVLVLLVMMFCWNKEAGKRCGLAILAATVWFPMVKNIVLRRRPYMVHPEEITPRPLPEADAAADDIVQQGFSFPSGHSAMSVATYGSLARETKKKWTKILAVALPLLIGISRFASGVHYPTDVLAGWVIGLAAIGFTALLEKKVKNETVRYLILLATALPGIFWCSSRDYFSALGALAGVAAAIPFEKKYINFRDTRRIPAMILRLAGAMAIYLLLNWLLKKPFDTAFLNSGTPAANLIRSLRYGILLFVVIGVYPRCFPVLEKLGVRKSTGSSERNGSR